MSDPKRIVTLIPAKPLAERQAMKRQLRVAAYCRVSTEEEEQQSSYEAQCTYYTDKIMTNPEWTMAGIFADEGITGTSTKKRDDFNRMIRRCKAKKIEIKTAKLIQFDFSQCRNVLRGKLLGPRGKFGEMRGKLLREG